MGKTGQGPINKTGKITTKTIAEQPDANHAKYHRQIK